MMCFTPEDKTMIDTASRRDFLAFAAAATAAASALTLSASAAYAEQGNMERALAALQSALESLNAATPNKGGHKETATQLIKQAIGQVEAGIQWANEHGGG
jgi:hypothetical protein